MRWTISLKRIAKKAGDVGYRGYAPYRTYGMYVGYRTYAKKLDLTTLFLFG